MKNKSFCSNKDGSERIDNQSPLPTPIDWKPQENCYFCVDGKLLTVNDKGDLVAESGTVHTEPELANNRVSFRHSLGRDYKFIKRNYFSDYNRVGFRL